MKNADARKFHHELNAAHADAQAKFEGIDYDAFRERSEVVAEVHFMPESYDTEKAARMCRVLGVDPNGEWDDEGKDAALLAMRLTLPRNEAPTYMDKERGFEHFPVDVHATMGRQDPQLCAEVWVAMGDVNDAQWFAAFAAAHAYRFGGLVDVVFAA